MDIRAKTVLDLVKSVKGAENAVIAGGAVRDFLGKVPNRDVDIFIPLKAENAVHEAVRKLIGEKPRDKREEYISTRHSLSKSIRAKPAVDAGGFYCYAFKFEDVDFDIITSDAEDGEDFGENVIENFDYALSMAYYDGLHIRDENEEFQRDFKNGYMTLRRLANMNDLPRAINRFNSISDRWKATRRFGLEFRCSCLSMKRTKAKASPKIKELDLIAEEKRVFDRVRAGILVDPNQQGLAAGQMMAFDEFVEIDDAFRDAEF